MKLSKNSLTILISLCFILFFKYLPPIEGLTTSGLQVIGIFIGIIILWMRISIDWPSLLCILAIALVPEMNFNSIISSSIGSSTFAFLMFTFMCTYALSQTSFIRRLALSFLNNKIARKGSWSFIILYFLSVLVLGAFMSPTVLVVVMIALTEEIFSILELKKGSKVASMMMAGMVFVSGIAAGMTPIAHVFPLMALSFYQNTTGLTIGYLDYLTVGIPVAFLSFIAMILMFKYILKPNLSEIKTRDLSSLQKQMPSFTTREKTIISIFFMVVALWIIPDILRPILPEVYNLFNQYGTAFPPLIGVCLLSMISIENKPLLNFKDAMSKGIPWASLIMVAGTLTLASALTNNDIGIVSFITSKITPLTASLTPIALIALFLFWASIQTNLSSNMVTVTVVCTIALPITMNLANINTAALASLIGMMASYAFATPPAMATIVFAIGSGWTETKDMAKYGFILMIITTLIATFIGYPIASLIM